MSNQNAGINLAMQNDPSSLSKLAETSVSEDLALSTAALAASQVSTLFAAGGSACNDDDGLKL
jgi:hypothetical protein